MATYSWDVRDKLRQAVVQAGSQQQTRSWTYDGLGFVRSETLPELGGQAILYETYDPRGNPLRVRDPRVRQRFSYDKAGRVVKVEEADASWNPLRTLREFVYADANGSGDWRKGKLWWQRAYNHWEDGTVVEVRQDYVYGGLLGAISQELLTVSTSAGSQASLSAPFVQRYGYGAHTV